MKKYDMIIIGTGAGGGTLAYKLADSGKEILILERGDFIPREKENWNTEEVFLKGRYKAKENWIDKNGKVFHPGIHYCVGGNTKVYGAALLRMRKEDFNEVLMDSEALILLNLPRMLLILELLSHTKKELLN